MGSLGFKWSNSGGDYGRKKKSAIQFIDTCQITTSCLKSSQCGKDCFPGAAPHMLVATKITGKTSSGENVRQGVRQRRLLDVTLRIKGHSFKSYK